MTELRNILDQAILFYERYPAEIDTTLGYKTNDEFWTLEEMYTSFTMDNSQYVIHQVWNRNLFNNRYNLTIYKDNKETDLGVFFLRNLVADLNRKIRMMQKMEH